MSTPEKGDIAVVDYTGKFEDGTVFDSTSEGKPIEFVVGESQVIEGFEEAVADMNVGEKKEVVVPPEKAYGAPSDQLRVEVPKDRLPPEIDPQVGLALEVRAENGETMQLLITSVGEESVTLDGNHPLAGKDLHFELELKDVKKSEAG